MTTRIDDQVVDFYHSLFGRIFSDPFQQRIPERLKRNAVVRDIQGTADAASQSLTPFFLNAQLTELQVANVLAGFAVLPNLYMDGTSMATPHVAGVAALLMAANPHAPVSEIIKVLPRSHLDRQATITKLRQSTVQTLGELDSILTRFDGKRLAEINTFLASVPVKITVARISELAASAHVKAILEDQPIASLS